MRASGYRFESNSNVWLRPAYSSIAYSDGDEFEERLANIIGQATDLSVFSIELRQKCTDWASLYHLSSSRANILRPMESILQGADVLEVGAGCGAITRYLGESGANVIALEGSLRRAAIARSRTRDLDNVDVVADRFSEFSCKQKFDVVTLIGVLEYANLFTPGDMPAQAMLERVCTFLKPGGRVVIAIENQLGLKYFAGAPEDHLGQAMYGIEGRYRKDQPQTFGRRALERILSRSGFNHLIFMAPFPDYKFPASIVTEAGFSDPDFDASALAWQSARRDPQLPPLLSFSPELVWPGIFDNKIALDLANSFLVVASPSDHQLINSRVLAYHFSTDRYPEYCKETKFLREKNESIKVVCRSLSQVREEKSSSFISFHPEPESDYILGTALSRDFVNIVSRDGWRIKEIGEFILRYLNIVAHLSSSKQMSINCCSLEDSISGAVFDVIPQNIIVAEGGEWHLIDREWKLRSDITLGYLVFRALISLINLVSRFGSAEDVILSTPCELIVAAFNSIGFNIGAQELENYMAFDLEIQCQVSGWVTNKQDMH